MSNDFLPKNSSPNSVFNLFCHSSRCRNVRCSPEYSDLTLFTDSALFCSVSSYWTVRCSPESPVSTGVSGKSIRTGVSGLHRSLWYFQNSIYFPSPNSYLFPSILLSSLHTTFSPAILRGTQGSSSLATILSWIQGRNLRKSLFLKNPRRI